MKPIIPFALLSAFIAIPASAQGTAVTTPVGYETLPIVEGLNYLGIRLHEPTAASGALGGVSGTDLTVSDGVVDNLDPATTYLIEIESGANEGVINVISSFDSEADTVTTSDDLSQLPDFNGDESFSIRAVSTFATIFGEDNSAGLTSTAAFASSDQVWVFNGSSFDKFYFAQGAFGQEAEWKDSSGASVDPFAQQLVYADAFLINAQSEGDLVVSGEVKTGPTSIALIGQFNYVGGIYPVGATLASTYGIDNSAGLTSTGAFASSDQVWIFNGASFDKYYYAQGAFGQEPSWKDSAGAEVDAEVIEIPSGYLVVNVGDDQSATLSAPAGYNNL